MRSQTQDKWPIEMPINISKWTLSASLSASPAHVMKMSWLAYSAPCLKPSWALYNPAILATSWSLDYCSWFLVPSPLPFPPHGPLIVHFSLDSSRCLPLFILSIILTINLPLIYLGAACTRLHFFIHLQGSKAQKVTGFIMALLHVICIVTGVKNWCSRAPRKTHSPSFLTPSLARSFYPS